MHDYFLTIFCTTTPPQFARQDLICGQSQVYTHSRVAGRMKPCGTRARVAEKSNPSNLDCIQIEISASNLLPKLTHVFCFVAKLVLQNVLLFCINLVYKQKLYKINNRYRRICNKTECKCWRQTNFRQYLMQHQFLHPKCFKFLQLS